MIYANAAGTSWPKPPGVAEAVQRAMLQEPTHNAQLYRDGHRAVQRFFGIPDGTADRLLLAPSCTSALQVAIADLVYDDGDRIITSSLEHHALSRPVQKLAAERGIAHLQARYRPGEPIDLAQVEGWLREGRVRLVAVTGASNVTGERLPIRALADLAHEHGAWLLLDAAQLAGVVDVDVTALGVDLLVFAGHKGMQGPFGIGGMWAAPHVPFVCPAATCEVQVRADGARTAPYPGFCDLGSVDFPALAGLQAAIAWREGRSPDERERPLRLARRLLEGLRERRGCRVLGGDGERTATVSFVCDDLPLGDAQEHFRRHGVVVRAGTHCAPMALQAVGEPQGCVRVSFGPWNVDGDVDAVLQAVAVC